MAELPPFRYAFRLRQGPATLVRASFNDLPFYREPSTRFSNSSARADHLMVPGENTMTLELWGGPPSAGTNTQGPVELTAHSMEDIARQPPPEPRPGGTDPEMLAMARIKWPDIARELIAKDERRSKDPMELPFSHTVKFWLPEDYTPPLYRDIPPEPIPEEGTPELVEAVRRIRESLARQDARAFVDLFHLKLQEQQRYYGPEPESAPANILREMQGRFSKKQLVEPLDLPTLRFERRAAGRVVLVTRTNGLPVFSARGEEDPGSSFNLDPLFVRKDGAWTLYR